MVEEQLAREQGIAHLHDLRESSVQRSPAAA
jgi:hypothetical protein